MKEDNRAEELLLPGIDVMLGVCLAHVCLKLLLQSWGERNQLRKWKTPGY